MPFSEIMHKLKAGSLHSGSDKGPKVTSRKQAVAIGMSYKNKKGMGSKPKHAEGMSGRGRSSKVSRGFAGLG